MCLLDHLLNDFKTQHLDINFYSCLKKCKTNFFDYYNVYMKNLSNEKWFFNCIKKNYQDRTSMLQTRQICPFCIPH